jgi:hypothetical protein
MKTILSRKQLDQTDTEAWEDDGIFNPDEAYRDTIELLVKVVDDLSRGITPWEELETLEARGLLTAYDEVNFNDPVPGY